MENKLRIKFELTDEYNNNYISDTVVEVFHILEETDLDVIGRQLNIFLKQCGYIRRNDYIFMKDITEEEYDALDDYLSEYRNREKGNGDTIK